MTMMVRQINLHRTISVAKLSIVCSHTLSLLDGFRKEGSVMPEMFCGANAAVAASPTSKLVPQVEHSGCVNKDDLVFAGVVWGYLMLLRGNAEPQGFCRIGIEFDRAR